MNSFYNNSLSVIELRWKLHNINMDNASHHPIGLHWVKRKFAINNLC